MKKNQILRKSVAVCLMVLIVGISLLPINSGLSEEQNVANTQTCEKGFSADNDPTPPVTTISLNPGDPDGDNGWYVSDVTITLNATDNETGV